MTCINRNGFYIQCLEIWFKLNYGGVFILIISAGAEKLSGIF